MESKGAAEAEKSQAPALRIDPRGVLPVEQLPAPVLLFAEGRLLAANPAACDELGQKAEELLGSGFVDSLRPESAAELRDSLAAAGGPDAAAARLTVRRALEGRGDEYFELRLQPAEAGSVAAAVIDATEKHRLDAAIAALADSTVALDSSGRMAWRPFGNAGRFGVADENALGVNVLEWVHPDELPHLLESFAGLLAKPGSRQSELVRMRHPYVEDGWLLSRITAVNALENPAIGAVVIRAEELVPIDLVDDITRSSGRFGSITEAMPVGVVITDRSGVVVYRNELARDLLGLGTDAVGRTDWLAGLRSDIADNLDRVLSDALERQLRGTVVVQLEREGDPAWLRVDAVPQVDEAGKCFGLIATVLDVSAETQTRIQLADTQERLWDLATHDPLTHLANRTLFVERVQAALDRASSGNRTVAVLYCDLDDFKPVNDRYGHAVGDAVLKIVAQRILGVVRSGDLVARFGGDEFLVLCEGFGEFANVLALRGRLVESVSQPIEVDGNRLTIGMTVGVARGTTGTEVEQLIRDADFSMYSHKAAGEERG